MNTNYSYRFNVSSNIFRADDHQRIECVFSNYNSSILFGDSDILNLHRKLNDSGIPVIANSTVTSGNILCTAFNDVLC